MSIETGDLQEIPEYSEVSSLLQTPEQSASIAMPPPQLPLQPMPLVDNEEQARLLFSSLTPFDRFKIDYRSSLEPANLQNTSKAMARSPPSQIPEVVEPLSHSDTPAELIAKNVLKLGTAASTSEFEAF